MSSNNLKKQVVCAVCDGEKCDCVEERLAFLSPSSESLKELAMWRSESSELMNAFEFVPLGSTEEQFRTKDEYVAALKIKAAKSRARLAAHNARAFAIRQKALSVGMRRYVGTEASLDFVRRMSVYSPYARDRAPPPLHSLREWVDVTTVSTPRGILKTRSDAERLASMATNAGVAKDLLEWWDVLQCCPSASVRDVHAKISVCAAQIQVGPKQRPRVPPAMTSADDDPDVDLFEWGVSQAIVDPYDPRVHRLFSELRHLDDNEQSLCFGLSFVDTITDACVLAMAVMRLRGGASDRSDDLYVSALSSRWVGKAFQTVSGMRITPAVATADNIYSYMQGQGTSAMTVGHFGTIPVKVEVSAMVEQLRTQLIPWGIRVAGVVSLVSKLVSYMHPGLMIVSVVETIALYFADDLKWLWNYYSTIQGGALSVAADADPSAIFQPGELPTASDFEELLKARESVGKWADCVRRSQVFERLENLLGVFSLSAVAASSGILGEPRAARSAIAKVQRNLRSGYSVDDLGMYVIKFMSELSSGVLEAVRTGDPMKMFEHHRTLADLISEAEFLVGPYCLASPGISSELYQSKRASGEIPFRFKEPLTPSEAVDAIMMLVREIDAEIKLGSAQDPAHGKSLLSLTGELTAAAASYMAMSKGYDVRPVPYCVFAWGEPGVGKTTLMNTFMKVVEKRYNYPSRSVGGVVELQDTKYYDRVRNLTWGMQLNDRDKSLKLDPEKCTATKLMELIDPSPFEAEQAVAERKGSINPRPMVVTATSNHPYLRADEVLLEPKALFRRIHDRVEVAVHSDYKTQEGVDFESAVAAQKMNPECNAITYTVTRFHLGQGKFNVVYRTHSEEDILRYLIASYDRHLATRSETKVSSVLCECGLPSHSGECLAPLAQGRGDVAVGLVAIVTSVVSAVLTQQAVYHDFLTDGSLSRFCNHLYTSGYSKRFVNNLNKFLLYWLPGLQAIVSGGLVMAIGGAVLSAVRTAEQEKVVETALASNVIEARSGEPQPVALGATGWERFSLAETEFSPSPMSRSLSFEELVKMCGRRTFRLETSIDGRPGKLASHCFMIGGGMAIAASHMFIPQIVESCGARVVDCSQSPFDHPVRVKMSSTHDTSSQYYEAVVHQRDIYKVPESDVVVFYVEKLPHSRIISDLFTNVFAPGVTVDDAILVGCPKEPGYVKFERVIGICGQRLAQDSILYGPKAFGDCGLACVIKMGASVFIGGVHVAGLGNLINPGGITGVGAVVSVAQLRKAQAKFGSRAFECAIPQAYGIVLAPLDRSEHRTWATVQSVRPDVPVIGSLGSVYKKGKPYSRISRTPVSSEPFFAELEMSVCGAHPYWVPPNFRGRLTSEQDQAWFDSKGLPRPVWTEPLVLNLLRSHDSDVDEAALARALGRMKAAYSSADFDNVRPLSDYEALRGIPGSLFRAMNLRTSVGPPFEGKKKSYIIFDDVNKSVWVHPEIVKMKLEIEALCLQGIVPTPVTLACEKDESVPVVKSEMRDARTFNILACAQIWVYRKYCTPLDMVDVAGQSAFETRVGINCADPMQVSALVRDLSGCDFYLEEDGRAFDVVQARPFCAAATELHVHQAELAGYSSADVVMVRALSRAGWNFVKLVKGELIFYGYSNPSGDPRTTIWNCRVNRLVSSYAAEVVCPQLDYDGVKLTTFGDDRLRGLMEAYRVHLEAMNKACEDAGMYFTSGSDKSLRIDPKDTLEGLSFLKRTFRREADDWFMALSEKSLVNMLATKGDSSLSAVDHHAVVFSTVLVEASLHAESVFNRWAEVIDRCVDFYRRRGIDVERSSFYVRQTFEEYRARYVARKLAYWGPSVDIDSDGFVVWDEASLEAVAMAMSTVVREPRRVRGMDWV